MLVKSGVITPQAGARELGYADEDAGTGPVVTRIVDDTPSPDKSKIETALDKWEKKACNSLSKGKGAQVTFESDYIPDGVNEVIYTKLKGAASKDQVRGVFAKFQE